MADTMIHRGPDDDGFFVEGNVGLGHRRLSIIDLGGGKQPIFNEDESAVIMFNGEVYNYAALTEELVARGHSFRTRSDTEAIIHAYEEYGDDCVSRLRGMFAFAIWDRRKKRLLLVRDRLGIKPVYYYMGGGILAFASEIKALLELPEIPREVDPDALDLYLSLRYVPGPRTMFKNIFKLQPGHLLVADHSGVQTKKYWDLEYREPEHGSLKSYLESFEELLEESVRLRLVAEVPLGVFLSGGLDSSAILALMSKATGGERVSSFSVGYEESAGEENEANEFEYARMASAAFAADHHEFRVGVTGFRDLVPDLVWHLDEPLADPSCIPLYLISKLARRYITVVLSGEGADEALAGYGIYHKMLALDRIYNGLGPLASPLASLLSRLAPGESVRRYMSLSGLPLESRYRGVSRGLSPALKQRLLGRKNAPGSENLVDELFGSYFRKVEKASPLDRMLYVDAKVWLPDDLLLKADKMTMANSLELRVPFLDHKFLEFTAGLPGHLKLHGGNGKFLLREAMRGVLPEPIINRSKKGFPVPTEPWLRGGLVEFTREALLSPDSSCRRFMDSRVVEEIVNQHQLGRTDRHQEIWTLLIFEFWHRLFIEGSLNRPARQKEQFAQVAV
jgi:asparagine synthase (glutamine-hydrolysing)